MGSFVSNFLSVFTSYPVSMFATCTILFIAYHSFVTPLTFTRWWIFILIYWSATFVSASIGGAFTSTFNRVTSSERTEFSLTTFAMVMCVFLGLTYGIDYLLLRYVPLYRFLCNFNKLGGGMRGVNPKLRV